MLESNFVRNRGHWIFDLDGTLTVSAHDFDHMRRELGLAPQVPILEALQAMPQEQSAPLWKTLNELEFYYAGKASVMEGANALLQQLHSSGRRLAILTRNTMPVVQQTLQACAIDHFFPLDHILDRDCCLPKPAPDGILHLLSLWQADAEDTVMVGDYLYDLEAGKQAGVATIHLDTRGDEDWSALTDLRVGSLGEITRYLR
ncbi:MAG: HAD family hydrolase [Gammaproteobacteria bacterium]|nr:HAD family hydrolase [Gammaproteobacteria bacterium]MBL6998979.1 HAD family hydrolase [Gammaproteobacteria bacterium]